MSDARSSEKPWRNPDERMVGRGVQQSAENRGSIARAANRLPEEEKLTPEEQLLNELRFYSTLINLSDLKGLPIDDTSLRSWADEDPERARLLREKVHNLATQFGFIIDSLEESLADPEDFER